MKNIIGLIGGIIFAIGLVVSGMTNPEKVIGFLDIFGEWDYSLAFVMGGAVMVNLLFFTFILKRKPLFNEEHALPTVFHVDKALVLGSALFGIGWGLVGICPGPGIVNLVTFEPIAIIFVLSLYVGMIVHKGYLKIKG